ncbi:M1 family metallopeptidase [Engelhardtia mirabilis]|uniref:Aminopeptidase N n=1 Tax=Engelhardtia mirabilis TaxID=2528011 RepID=A0A518BQ49_9BACT|nr:Peptidase family M1 [Planctomycetes bacterium Pla133]QDV03418.1 Peptidase family M1 [Planctomycetes bacterium Pla86]
MSCLSIAAAVILATPPLAPSAPQEAQDSGGPLDAERACYDVLRYDLSIQVDPQQERILGSNRITARLLSTTDRIRVDLDRRLAVHDVSMNDIGHVDAVGYVDVNDVVTGGERTEDFFFVPIAGVSPGDVFTIDINYGGSPREAVRAPWDGGFVWAQTPSGAPWIATACQGEGADLWWPCKDHPSDEPDSMGIDVEVPDPLVVATNGRLLGTWPAARPGHTIHRWEVSTPINNYGVALNIAPYVRLEHLYTSVTGERFPFYFWVLPEDEAKGRAILPEFAGHMRQLEELCGPYPFRADKYGVVQTPHLGMEHQSIIAYGNRFAGDPNFEYDWLHHHELSHEWWGNMVTARDWNDFWIHEGIGTYVQALYLEQRFGPEAYRQKMAADRRRIANTGPVAPRGSKSTGWMYLGRPGNGSPGGDIYFKGSWVCHELRWLLGDDEFFHVLRRWAYPDPALELVTDGAQCRFTTTDELLEIANRETGRDLAWYFEVALRRAALPTLETQRDGTSLTLRWSTPDDLPYPMPVELDLDGHRRTVPIPPEGTTIDVGQAKLTIDPDDWLLGAE